MEAAASQPNILIGLASVIALVLLNGFFVAAEFALVSVRPTRVEEMVSQDVRGSRAVRQAIHDPDQFIAATQLGITLASLGLGWVGEPALASVIDPVVGLLPLSEAWHNTTAHTISAAIAFAFITFTHVVVGELAPKSIALQQPEKTALVVARPTMLAEAIFRPGIWLLNGAGNLILRTLGFEPASGHEMVHSVEELRMLVEATTTQGLLALSEQEMLEAIFDLRLLIVRQVMVPRTEMVTIPANTTLRQLLRLQKEYPHTKIPVYETDRDHLIGILYLRDVIDELADGNLSKTIQPFIRSAIYLPESTRITSALVAFREGRQHIAIVLDEYGGTAGLITLEDILEEISGEIPDQFEVSAPEIIEQGDGSWLISGLMQIEEVNEALETDLSDENYDTIGGYVMGKLERIPAPGDEVSAGGLHFRVKKVDGRRIDQLHILRSTPRP
jgi:CBS domain containing-hemolysin-like protein